MDQTGKSNCTAADYLIASKQCDILSLEQLLQTGRLVVSISNLIHALQRERGASNLHLASGGQRFAADLPPLRDHALEMEQQFRDCLADIDPDSGCIPGASRLFSRIAYAIHGLQEVEAVRGRVRELSVEPEAVVEGYSALIQGLLAVVFEAADTAADPDISKLLVAMFHLMQGKEFAGQERALGAAGFAGRGFGENDRERLGHFTDNQERCFQIFASFADPDSIALWKRVGGGSASAEVERYRRLAFASGVRQGTGGDDNVSDAWFEATTRRIDGMKRVEDQLEASLEALCKQKIATAKADLDSHAYHIEALTEHPPERPSFAIFFNESATAMGGSEVGPESVDADCASPQLGRSLVDLVQSQSVRLQAMSEELSEARAALSERKTIEKAKGLIMRHRNMSEEEAYKFLRQVAMAQSRKLGEVASDTIAMADILKDG